jgi:hypothetical protein
MKVFTVYSCPAWEAKLDSRVSSGRVGRNNEEQFNGLV